MEEPTRQEILDFLDKRFGDIEKRIEVLSKEVKEDIKPLKRKVEYPFEQIPIINKNVANLTTSNFVVWMLSLFTLIAFLIVNFSEIKQIVM